MNDADFRNWLEVEVRDDRMTVQQREDLLEQKRCFDRNRGEIEALSEAGCRLRQRNSEGWRYCPRTPGQGSAGSPWADDLF